MRLHAPMGFRSDEVDCKEDAGMRMSHLNFSVQSKGRLPVYDTDEINLVRNIFHCGQLASSAVAIVLLSYYDRKATSMITVTAFCIVSDQSNMPWLTEHTITLQSRCF